MMEVIHRGEGAFRQMAHIPGLPGVQHRLCVKYLTKPDPALAYAGPMNRADLDGPGAAKAAGLRYASERQPGSARLGEGAALCPGQLNGRGPARGRAGDRPGGPAAGQHGRSMPHVHPAVIGAYLDGVLPEWPAPAAPAPGADPRGLLPAEGAVLGLLERRQEEAAPAAKTSRTRQASALP